MPRAYRETFVVERSVITRDAAGGAIETWQTVATIFGDYEATSYSEQARRGQMGGGVSATVRTRWLAGVTGAMRLRWSSNGNRLLYISSVVPKLPNSDLELTVEEKVT
jgi:head-tail adaptor